MKKRLFTTTLLMVGLIPALVGCGSPQPTPTPKYPENITLDKEDATLLYTEGASTQESVVLTATVTPSDYTQGTITWGGGKSYDTTYVTLKPSADGKSCTVTAAAVCKDGVEVYAKIMGESGELTARCTVYVNAPKVHATSIEFTDTTPRNATINNVILLNYTTVPATHNDLIQATSSDTSVATGIPITTKGYVQVSPKGPGTATFTIAAFDGEVEKCRCTQTVTVTVSDALDVTVTPGQKVKTSFDNVKQEEAGWNVFKFTLGSNVTISKSNKFSITVTPKDATAPDVSQVKCFVGMTEKGSSNWIVNTAYNEDSYVEYNKEYSDVLVAGKVYYIQIKNKVALTSKAYDVHVELPAA